VFKFFSALSALVCLSSHLFSTETGYDFAGRHLIASYLECNTEALNDVARLEAVMAQAVQATGAQILSSSKYVFPGNGLSMVFLLSESHASIHTYPEHKSCFVDLFTCGEKCRPAEFEAILEEYLSPAKVDRHYYLRSTITEEIERVDQILDEYSATWH
jgi:S-adenosylmethionine decarboxylase